MAYNNRGGYTSGYNRNNQGYNGRQSFGGGYNQGYNNQQPKKKSGYKVKFIDGKPFISAWKKAGRGAILVAYARPYKNTKEKVSEQGKTWFNLFVTITNSQTAVVTKTSGMFCKEDKRLYIKDLNLIGSTAGRGGYFGKHISK